ncbi:MAG: peptide-binding protein [Deltaproteobacteria bacterium]|nr:peptide-binding protein [Deltaproteobacteria bacterium]
MEIMEASLKGPMLLAIVLGLLGGCQYRVPRDAGGLTIALAADPSSLNPITSNDAATGEVLSYVMETLADRDPATLAWRPKLAERWEVSPDHQTFTYHLRDGVRWHDGAPFTADDVLYSYERIMDPAVDAAVLRGYYKEILHVEKVDEATVRFTYRQPYFMAFEFTAGIPIVPKHAFDDGTDFNTHPAGRHPLGTGPYRFVEWVTSRRIVLERNPSYWRAAPAIDGVVFRIVPERTVSFQALKKGEIDFATLFPVQWARQTNNPRFLDRFTKHRYYLPTEMYLGWNIRRPYFSDRRVRQALTMLIDRERMLARTEFGEGRLISGPAYPDHPSYDRSIASWPYDPASAARLLDDAGWTDSDGDGWRDKDGIPFRFRFLYRAGSSRGDLLANVLREDLQKVGIGVDAQRLEWTTYVKTINDRAFDAMFGGWVGPVEMDQYQLWHSSQAAKGSNHVGFADPEADRLLEAARREFEPEKRAALYRQLHRILHEEQPYTFLLNPPELVAADRRFTNVRAYTLGFESLEWGVNRAVELWQ